MIERSRAPFAAKASVLVKQKIDLAAPGQGFDNEHPARCGAGKKCCCWGVGVSVFFVCGVVEFYLVVWFCIFCVVVDVRANYKNPVKYRRLQ